MKHLSLQKASMTFVILLGIVSLFADMTYESARSITGQYLEMLGASGTVVGITAGLGGLIGYSFRLLSGYISDKTERYWLITFVGYVVTLFAVPLLALAGSWPVAVFLISSERMGKAIRTPARDAMLSYATKKIGRGWGFGLHEALDQIGAIVGPVLMSAVLYFRGSYQTGFALLLIPAILSLLVLTYARMLYPQPRDLEIQRPVLQTKGFSKKYWLYVVAVSCVAAGYVDFSLIAYHFAKSVSISHVWIPAFFGLAMLSDGVAALILGKWYDKKGIVAVTVAIAVSSLFVPLVFLGGLYASVIGMILWGVGMGAQESVMRAVVANLVPVDRRGTAFGLLNLCFGIFWFLGSTLIGFLYDLSMVSLVSFAMGIQLMAIVFLCRMSKLRTTPCT